MAVNTAKDESAQEDDDSGMLTVPEHGHVPFDGHAQAVDVPVTANNTQLIEEVYHRLGDRSAYEVVLTADDFSKTLYVLGDVNPDIVQAVVKAHIPDDNYGLSEHERTLKALRGRLSSGEDLSPEDLNTLLRSML